MSKPGPRPRDVIARMDARTDKGPGCWIWLGKIDQAGYGRIWLDGKDEYVHRIAFARLIGPIPAGLCVCHSCDNRRCWRPEHFFLGTRSDNHADMFSKGRQARGIMLSGLSEAVIHEIRRRAAAGEAQAVIAAEFGLHQSHVSRIHRRRRWAHLQQENSDPN